MDNRNIFRLSVNVQIQNAQWASGGLMIRDEVVIEAVDFKQAAEILEAFHVLTQKYKVEQ